MDLSTWEKPDTCRDTFTIGVHGYNWISKVLGKCITLEDGVAADFEVANKFMSKVSYLRRCGFTPYIVFDGDELPMKKATYSKGKAQHTMKRKEPRVTHDIVFSLIETLNSNNVKSVVAPYKADAQLAFLLLNKHVDVILTEDPGQILIYGCEKIIFDYKGDYYEYDFSKLKGKHCEFSDFSKEMVSQACMLGGCDYLSSLPGVGVTQPFQIMKKKRKEMVTCEDPYLRVLAALKATKGKENEISDYIQRFTKVMHTYRHQRVYDETSQTIVCLTGFQNETEEDLQQYIGPLLTSTNFSDEDIANGRIHPISKNRMKVTITPIEGGYVHSEVDLIGKDELQRNLEISALFKNTSALKVWQEAMFNVAQHHFFTISGQISKDRKVSKACQKYEVEHNYNFLGEADASFGSMSKEKIDEAESYKVDLEKKVIGPLNDLIDDASLQDARDFAELYSRARQEAHIQGDLAKLQTLQKLCVETHKALSSIEAKQRKTTYEIMVRMSKLESLYCKNLASTYETMLKSFES